MRVGFLIVFRQVKQLKLNTALFVRHRIADAWLSARAYPGQ